MEADAKHSQEVESLKRLLQEVSVVWMPNAIETEINSNINETINFFFFSQMQIHYK